MSTIPALERRNPTVKLGLVVVISFVVMFVLDPWTPAVLYLLALTGVAASTRTGPRTLLVAHVPFAAFALGVLVVNALSRPGEILWQAGVLRVTTEGLTVGAALAVRTLLVGVLAIGFLVSTDAVALMHSLRQNARLSPRVAYAVLAGHRLLQDMPREWATIQQAHAVRAPLRRGGGPPRGPRHLARVVFSLLVVSVRRGERMAQALESRGLGLHPRTTWRPVHVTPADWALAASVLAVVALVLLGSGWLGVLRGPAALTG
ncbi:energy-coupling factor transporter transmembrane component T [Georgenia phoenicis]|uniref:energy-coupling factor transporter transmembrane component T family protein n=1 Tax=unclassified Georgenia TaxID=2626815 RepID=UPI0039AEDFD1